MGAVYLVGQLTVKDEAQWAEYRAQVPATLAPWGAVLLFRGQLSRALAGASPHGDIVVIEFPSQAAVDAWYDSAPYQALIPLRNAAADVVLLSYQT